MRHFLKIADAVNVAPLLHQLHSRPDLWDENTLRTTHPVSPHKECSDIWVWFNEIKQDVTEVVDDITVVPFKAWYDLPAIRHIIFDLMRFCEGVGLGRVLITRLAPGKGIPDHVDEGAPAEYFQRYQVVLQSGPGCVFQIEDERVTFKPGEVWKINNRAKHSVYNGSADDRIVMIVDIRTASQC